MALRAVWALEAHRVNIAHSQPVSQPNVMPAMEMIAIETAMSG